VGNIKYVVKQLGYLIIFSAVFSSTVVADAYKFQCSGSQTVSYEIIEGDNLYTIGKNFGDNRFWEYLYMLNASQINNPHLIFPGQTIDIPLKVVAYKNGQLGFGDILDSPFCDNELIAVNKIKEEYLVKVDLDEMVTQGKIKVKTNDVASVNSKSVDGEALEEFRNAFQKLVDAEKAAKKKDLEPFRMEVDGMVLDETISKIGRDFYNVFYQYWSGPKNAYNYTITIAEKPAPSLGTIVTVKVNDTFTYQSRLQPRYELIEEAGKAAVRYSYSHLQRNNTGLTIY
jgi:hypothetical protein